MKIKISRSQWEGIGKKAGWINEKNYLSLLEFDGIKEFYRAMDRIVAGVGGNVSHISPLDYEKVLKNFFGDFSKLDPKLKEAIESSIMEHLNNWEMGQNENKTI